MHMDEDIATLDTEERFGIQELATVLGEFEPLAKRRRLGKDVAERLVAKGLAERGAGKPTGYRLSELGRQLQGTWKTDH
jgi:hypothetical protein